MAIKIPSDEQTWPNFCYANPQSPASEAIINLLWAGIDDEEMEYEPLLLMCLLMLHHSAGNHHDVLAQFERIPAMASRMISAMIRFVETLRGNNSKKTGLCAVISGIVRATIKRIPKQDREILRGIILAERVYPTRRVQYLTSLLEAVENEERRLSLYSEAAESMRQRDKQVAYELAIWASTTGINFACQEMCEI